ncbi:unnamed protein product [Clonostachys rosea]|uniref:Myb-like domain-containing protein n=1 Tax=Bionectria ochroleuca TaxID=29856 RepID=A0ABY6US24_BIOOC|nr:unnamed protein product [Clonostachys rosea]
MNNKNWNDRADKDLFFTILSVKNIGVISGSEWITIGNHMRTLGYGFTNEGCRQHFQGLRRAQNKSGDGGSTGASNRRVDPTWNPITRRPGPGRGRPRKSMSSDTPTTEPSVPDAIVSGQPNAAPVAMPGLPPQVPGGQVYEPSQQPIHYPSPPLPHAQLHGQQPHPGISQPQPHVTEPHPQDGQPNHSLADDKVGGATSHHNVDVPLPHTASTAVEDSSVDALHLEPENDVDAEGEGDDEPPIKRQRIDSDDAMPPDSLEDDPVLALATANNAGSDPYPPDFSYAEA